MVKLSLLSPKGNSSARYFPYQGYLGLTPVRVDGFVRTVLEQDGRPILARDLVVAVRCYEARYSKFGTMHMNLLSEHSTTIWHKDDAAEWSELGDSDHPFRISVPAAAATATAPPSGALYFQGYRVFWRVEATLNHIPIPAVGSRQVKSFELQLVRYDTPVSHSLPTPSTPSSSPYSTSLTPRGLPLRYRTLAPQSPIGPLDIVTVQVDVQPPDPSVSIRSASAVVERRIQFKEASSVTHSPMDSMPCASIPNYIPDPTPSSGLYPSPGSSLQNLSSSASLCSDDSSRPLMQHIDTVSCPSSDRVTTHIVANSEATSRSVSDASGPWTRNLTFAWPESKSSSRWTVGETLQTEMVTIKFFLRIKLVVSSPTHGVENVELEDTELTVVSTNESQRQVALARFAEHTSGGGLRPKSKSPRRTKRTHAADQKRDALPSPPRSPLPPSPPPSSAASTTEDGHGERPGHTCQLSCASAPPGKTNVHLQSQSQLQLQSAAHSHTVMHGTEHTSKWSRRPHTVAGAHDQRCVFTGKFGGAGETGGVLRLEMDDGPERKCSARRESHLHGHGASRTSHANRKPHRRGTNTQSLEGGKLLCGRADQVEVRAWEEELARIETRSQKSSANMLGFLAQRKRSGGLLPAIRTILHAGE